MKLTEIAKRIHAHLKQFEADSAINKRRDNRYAGRPFYFPYAIKVGRNVLIRYVCYQDDSILNKTSALEYLNWLEKGNVGKHWEVLEL